MLPLRVLRLLTAWKMGLALALLAVVAKQDEAAPAPALLLAPRRRQPAAPAAPATTRNTAAPQATMTTAVAAG
jgi:hypothetical protein